MSLVAYGSDSDSEKEDEVETGTVVLIPKQATSTPAPANENGNHMFSQLPQPKNTTGAVEEEDDEFLRKKETPVEKPKPPKQAVKIGIPSLNDFNDEDDGDEPARKIAKKTPSVSKSGLFEVLPPPKTSPISTKSFVPHVLKRKTAAAAPKPLAQPVKPQKSLNEVVSTRRLNLLTSDDEDDDDDIQIDMVDDNVWNQMFGRKKKPSPKPKVVNMTEEETGEMEEPECSSNVDIAPSTSEPYSGLDNEAFQALVGKSKVRRENIKLIDINEEEVLPDEDVWMTKAITDPECKPKYVVEDPVNDVARRKHHITYLAQQAKANEQDLQNQWAANRFTRQQTQAKYGF